MRQCSQVSMFNLAKEGSHGNPNSYDEGSIWDHSHGGVHRILVGAEVALEEMGAVPGGSN